MTPGSALPTAAAAAASTAVEALSQLSAPHFGLMVKVTPIACVVRRAKRKQAAGVWVAAEEDAVLDTRVHRYLTDSMAREGIEAFARPVPRMLCSSVHAGDVDSLRVNPLSARGELVVASEFSAGGDLFDAVKALSSLRDDGCIRVMSPFALRDLLADLLAAVATMHRWGIAHRDISPENVLLTVPLPEVAGADAVNAVASNLGCRDWAHAMTLLSVQLSHGHQRGDAREDPTAPFGAVTAAVEAAFSVASFRSAVASAGEEGDAVCRLWEHERRAAMSAARAAAANADATIREIFTCFLHGPQAAVSARFAAMVAAVCAARAAVARRTTWASWSLPEGEDTQGLPAFKPAGRRCPAMERALGHPAGAAAAADVAKAIPMAVSEDWATEEAAVRLANLLFDKADQAAVSMCDGQAAPGEGDALPKVQIEEALVQCVVGMVRGQEGAYFRGAPANMLALAAGLAASGACAARIQFRLCDFGMAGDLWSVDTEAPLPAEEVVLGKSWFAPMQLRGRQRHTALVDEYGVGATLIWAATGGPAAPQTVCSRKTHRPVAYGATQLAALAKQKEWCDSLWRTAGGMWDVLCGLADEREHCRLPATLALSHPGLMMDVFEGGSGAEAGTAASFVGPRATSDRALVAAEGMRRTAKELQTAAASAPPGTTAADAIRTAAGALPGGAQLLAPSAVTFRCGCDIPASAVGLLLQMQEATERNHERAWGIRERDRAAAAVSPAASRPAH